MNEKILIIEDEKKIAKIYSDFLIKEGYKVEVAYDGEEGLKKFAEFNPDLILLDVLIPKLDGISLLKKIKDEVESKGIKVIILTNLESEEDAAIAFKEGLVRYLIKVNYSLKDLIKIIKEFLG